MCLMPAAVYLEGGQGSADARIFKSDRPVIDPRPAFQPISSVVGGAAMALPRTC